MSTSTGDSERTDPKHDEEFYSSCLKSKKSKFFSVIDTNENVGNFVEKAHNYILVSVNSDYGYEDLGENILYFSAEDDGYIAEVFVKGVSQGAIKNWKVREGDVVKVCYAKEGDTWQETEKIEAIGRKAYEQS